MSATGGALSVGVVVPVTPSGLTSMADALTDNHDVPTTLAVSPLAVSAVDATRSRDGMHAIEQLAALSGDEMIDQPYVPINLAALTGAGLSGEIGAQLSRGDDILRAVGLKPDGGAWVDTSSNLTQGDAGNLASGLQSAGATQAVLSDNVLGLGRWKHLHLRSAVLARSRARRQPSRPPRPTRRSARGSLPRPTIRSSERSSCWPGSRSSTSRTPSSASHAASWWSRRRAGTPRAPSWTRCSRASPRPIRALKAVTLSQLFADRARRRQRGALRAPAAVRFDDARHHPQRGRPYCARPPAVGLLQPGRGRASRQPDHAR